jgi:hypothetical protein
LASHSAVHLPAEVPAIPLLTFVACFQLFAAVLMVTDVSKMAALQIVGLSGVRRHRSACGDRGRDVVHAVF